MTMENNVVLSIPFVETLRPAARSIRGLFNPLDNYFGYSVEDDGTPIYTTVNIEASEKARILFE